MKLTAVYVEVGANPFLPDIRDLAGQFKYFSAEVPGDVDMAEMEAFAKEKVTVLNDMFPLKKYRYLRLEKR